MVAPKDRQAVPVSVLLLSGHRFGRSNTFPDSLVRRSLLSGLQYPFHRADEPGDVHLEILAAIDLHRIVIGEVAKAFRELFGTWHDRVRNQYWDQRLLLAQSRFDLKTNGVGGIGNAALGRIRARPLGSDDGQK